MAKERENGPYRRAWERCCTALDSDFEHGTPTLILAEELAHEAKP